MPNMSLCLNLCSEFFPEGLRKVLKKLFVYKDLDVKGTDSTISKWWTQPMPYSSSGPYLNPLSFISQDSVKKEKPHELI